MTQSFKPEGIGENIFSQRYAINSKETWAEACMRVASHVSNAEVTFQLKEEYKKKFYDDLLSNRFMPGGRIWYGSKRKKGGLINCFAEDVPVCTKRGLVPIKDIEINDMVLTEDGTFQKVVNKINQGHREKILFIDVDRMPNVLKVTPDHKIMTQRGWVEAKNLTTEDYVSVPGCNNVESIPDEINILDFLDEEFYNENLVVDNSGFIRKLNSGSSKNSSVGEYNKQWLPIKNNIKIDEDFMKFIGYYISEGCAENNGYRTIFTFSGKERSYVEEVKELFVKIFAKAATVQDYDTWMQVGISSKIVNSFMKNFIGAGFGSKILPWWFLNLPNNFLNILLAYTCRGDAHIDQTTGSIVLVMCNPNIMMQLFYIAQKLDLGMSFSFLYKKEERHSLPIGLRITKKWTYSKNFDEISDLIGKFKIKNDKFFRKINSVSEIFYGKDVWDISVDTNHSLQVAGMVASNCFVIKPEDSRESWGKTTSDMLVISGLGGGVGMNFSSVRPKGEKIKGVGGEASGPISLMKIINNVGEEIKTGGGRRVALMFCLNIDHPDILDFLQCKYSKKAESDADFMNEWNSHFVRASHDPQYLDSLNKMLSKEESKDFVGKIFKLLNDKKIQNANVSVVIPEGQFEKFSDAVKNDKDWQLKWKGKVKKTIKARGLWKTLVDNAYESAEPGILNFDLAERMSNLSYYAKISSTNPCLAKDTMVTTKKGLFPIQDLIGKEVEIWDGDQWVMVDNFRVTGENREMLKIELQDGSTLRATPNHNFILSDGSIKKASELNIDDELKTSDIPQAHGDIEVKGAYLKGFILGDGFYSGNDVILPLYNSKWNCKERLLQSGLEILTDKNYNGIAKDLGFAEPTNSAPNRVMMQGLNLRKSELKEFGLEYKKRLPKEIYQWNYKSKIEFIAGLFDSDGTAIDNSNGFGYQFWSIHLDFIRDLQLLLKTIGIKSKIDCSKKAEMKDFNDGYGEYQAKDCFRLSIAQRYSIVLADQVNFNRLTNLKNKAIKYFVKLNHNRIKSISEDGIDEKVYCCTVSTNNRFSCNYMILLGNCGEICMQPNSVCCLGSLVLPRFHNNETGFFDFEGLSQTIKNAVRFLDNVLEINKYPTKETKKEAKKTRRIGLGIMGLHDLLLMRGLKYSSPEGLSFVSRLMNLIKNDAYEASIELAKEKGSFAVFNFEGYSKSEFFKSLDPDLQKSIEDNGIRNCAILSIAPTGTISMVCGVTSGIEPIFAYAYKRKYFKGDNLEVENVIHPLYRECIENGKSVDHFQSSYDLSVKDHLEIQKVCQVHVDQAISKTINVPANYPKEELYSLFLDYLPYLKGLTIYVDGSRGGAPLESMSYEEASQVISCPKGVCEIG